MAVAVLSQEFLRQSFVVSNLTVENLNVRTWHKSVEVQDSVFKRGSPGFRENWEVVPYGGETVLFFRRFELSPPAFASTTLRRRFVASSDKVRKLARRHAVMPVLCNNVATAYFFIRTIGRLP